MDVIYWLGITKWELRKIEESETLFTFAIKQINNAIFRKIRLDDYSEVKLGLHYFSENSFVKKYLVELETENPGPHHTPA